MMQGEAAEPAVAGRDADPYAGADRIPELVAVGELNRLWAVGRTGSVDHAVDGVEVYLVVER